MYIYYDKTTGDLAATAVCRLKYKDEDPRYECVEGEIDTGVDELRFWKKGPDGPVRKSQSEIDGIIATSKSALDVARANEIVKLINDSATTKLNSGTVKGIP